MQYSRLWYVLGVLLIAATGVSGAYGLVHPEQISLTMTAQEDEMIISWLSREPLPFPLPSVKNFPCANGNNTEEMIPIPFPFPSPAPLPQSVVQLLSSNGTTLSSHTNVTQLFLSHYSDYRLVHNVLVRPLTPGQHYSFTVSTLAGTNSQIGSFQQLWPARADASLDVLIITDVGANEVTSNPVWMQQIQNSTIYDLIVHPGDIAYDIDIGGPGNTLTNGDVYMNAMMAAMAQQQYIPYHVYPGNHEAENNYCDFLNFRARFSHNKMIDASSNSVRYFGWNAGPVHFAGIDTNAYNQADFNLPRQYWIQKQWDWLENDLRSVNRSVTPWVIVLTHHPLYCTQICEGWPSTPWCTNTTQNTKMDSLGFDHSYTSDCSVNSLLLRNGCAGGGSMKLDPYSVDGKPCRRGEPAGSFGLEPLLKQFQVDLVMSGHTHDWEAMWPVMNGQLTEKGKSYHNPMAPVHIVNGASGGKHGGGFGKPWPFTRARNNSVSSSFAHVTAHNATHLTVRQKVGETGEIMDSFTIIHDDR